MSYKEQRPRICPEFVYLFPTRNHIVLILGIHIIIWGPRHRSCLVFHTNCDVPVVGGGGWLISYSPGHGLFLKKEFSEAFFREGERLILKMPTERIKEDPRRWEGNWQRVGSWELREELLGEESPAVPMLPRECKTRLQFPPQRVTETPVTLTRWVLGEAQPRPRVDLMQQR